jgi:hypothetical protein
MSAYGADAADPQIELPMATERIKHMVEEGHPGFDIDRACAIQLDRHRYVRLTSLSLDRSCPDRHGGHTGISSIDSLSVTRSGSSDWTAAASATTSAPGSRLRDVPSRTASQPPTTLTATAIETANAGHPAPRRPKDRQFPRSLIARGHHTIVPGVD